MDTDPNRQAIGLALKALRKRTGIVATAVARSTGLSPETLYHWEAGNVPAALAQLGRICERIGTTPNNVIPGPWQQADSSGPSKDVA